jgi:NhaA family Na+:H+ antiporter
MVPVVNPQRIAQEKTPIMTLVRPFQDFAGRESSGGILLFACALVALVWANSPWAHHYTAFWHTTFTVGLGSFQLSHELHFWVNDALMAVFFFVVGLEIKRELLAGELSSARQAALPILTALGGVVVPALLYTFLNANGPGARGWGIPMATDIAFAIGVMALLGDRVPLGLKVFLTALAIVDDFAAVLVIAVFHTANLAMGSVRNRSFLPPVGVSGKPPRRSASASVRADWRGAVDNRVAVWNSRDDCRCTPRL